MSKYLQPEHPSSGCGQAWFLYAVRNPRGPGFCRLVLVEAKNHAAVAFLERVGDDGRVSETVSVMTVHRQCPMIGIRSELVEEIEFTVFANDMVDRARVDRDPLAVQAYVEAGRPPPAPAPVPAPAHARQGENYKKIFSVLKEADWEDQAGAVLAGMGDVESRPMGEALQEAVDLCREREAS
jgi:hypothetical protein